MGNSEMMVTASLLLRARLYLAGDEATVCGPPGRVDGVELSYCLFRAILSLGHLPVTLREEREIASQCSVASTRVRQHEKALMKVLDESKANTSR